MPEGIPIVRLSHVSKAFLSPDADGPPLKVLEEINLVIQTGESLAILGPSGSGKSTLLHLLGSLDRPSEGQVLLDGQDLNELNDVQLANLRNEKIGFIFQNHHLLPQCTALENVLIPTLAKSPAAATQDDIDRAATLINRVGLSERSQAPPGKLSGGECQRVAVVRALINQPKIILADEPTGSLDGQSAENLAQLLVELNRENGVTLIVVTHSIQLARQMSRVLELRDGNLHPWNS